MENNFLIVGAGLAGCEAAWQLASRGINVTLMEMRPEKTTPAHETDFFAELVCSNSLKATGIDTGSGLLKEELSKYGSLLIKTAYDTRVPAGGALAVDRKLFSEKITEVITSHPNISVKKGELTEIPSVPCLIATGPLTSDTLANKIKERFGGCLYFADAISPIISADSIDKSKGYFLGRYGKGGDDYFNLPLTEDEYNAFYDALVGAETAKFHDFESIDFFEGCMPVEVMASRGRQTLSFGPMKPVGLEDPKTGKRPYAVMQLRKENLEATAFNIVGFQTKMTIPEQKRVFGMIKGLEKAEFLRYGSVHRNTYINGPAVLNRYFQAKDYPNLFFAGQITGLEGYIESIAGGLIAGLQISAYLKGLPFYEIPSETALGSLSKFVCGESGLAHAVSTDYTPSNFHFGMLPPLKERIKDKRAKKTKQALSALEKADKFIEEFLK